MAARPCFVITEIMKFQADWRELHAKSAILKEWHNDQALIGLALYEYAIRHDSSRDDYFRARESASMS